MVVVIAIIMIAVIVYAFILTGKAIKKDDEKLNIVTTSFSSYDFVKHIVGDYASVTFLLGAGVDAHSYEPAASDLIKIQNADIFIYVGGEMEPWTDKVLNSDTIKMENTTLIKISESVDTIEEQEVDGAEKENHHSSEKGEEHHEEDVFDGHIWTSTENAIKMMKYLNAEIAKKDIVNKATYKKNADKYIKEIKNLQTKIQKIVNNKKRNRLVFGDKMPMQYFLNEFGLIASAAFGGCSTETEPSSKTIAYLVNKVREEKIPVVLYVELSTGKTAKTIAEETGTKAMQIQTLHNLSKDDFDKGETYVSLMTRNLDVLKEALQ